jgi:DNA-binding MarR family transcriptional regulator
MEHEGRRVSIERYLPYLINRSLQAMRDYSAEIFAQLGLSIPTFRILFALAELGPTRFGELAEITSLEPPTLSRFLNQLEGERLVRRKRVPHPHSKAVEIALTAAGRRKVEQAIPDVVDCEERYLEGVSRADAEIARKVINRIYENARSAAAERDATSRRIG